MSSASLTPYKNNSTTQAFTLVSNSATGALYSVASRSLATPYTVQITRKVGSPGALGNDHVFLKVSLSDPNSTTGKIATGSATLDISIPRDVTTVTQAELLEVLGILSSLLNDSTALAATTVARTALLEGRDL